VTSALRVCVRVSVRVADSDGVSVREGVSALVPESEALCDALAVCVSVGVGAAVGVMLLVLVALLDSVVEAVPLCDPLLLRVPVRVMVRVLVLGPAMRAKRWRGRAWREKGGGVGAN